MNRRGFISSILKAGVAAAVLPGAVTYVRKWQPTRGVLVPIWYETRRSTFVTDLMYEAEMQRRFVDAFFFGKLILPPHKTFQELEPIEVNPDPFWMKLSIAAGNEQ